MQSVVVTGSDPSILAMYGDLIIGLLIGAGLMYLFQWLSIKRKRSKPLSTNSEHGIVSVVGELEPYLIESILRQQENGSTVELCFTIGKPLLDTVETEFECSTQLRSWTKHDFHYTQLTPKDSRFIVNFDVL